ncbi:MAG: hypothetical protein IJ151_04245 [Bacteroidales bacterium]|nr:hypothetical protein [Bacteroidales bacterium]
MKKKILITLLLGIISVAALHAQDGYAIDNIFAGRYFSKADASEVTVKGSDLTAYKLNRYHSISTVCDADVLRKIAADVLKDANNATDIETEYKGDLPTYILFRTVRISPKNKNTYICYKVTPLEDEKYKVIVVWMTGDATIEELKAMFRK